MPVDAHPLTIELDRMDDDGGPPRHALSTTTPRLVPRRADSPPRHPDASHPATAADSTHEWYRRLGASHRRRDESARLTARAIEERDNAQQIACHRRWPGIVQAMRTLIDCYNDGAGAEILILVDDVSGPGNEPTATVTARSGRTIVMAVDGADLSVRGSQDEDGRIRDERLIGLNRSDEATAGYVLQNWLAQEEPCDTAIRVPPSSSSTREFNSASTIASRPQS